LFSGVGKPDENCYFARTGLPPLDPKEAMMRVKKVRKRGVDAEK
jgi:hypothetical protein